MAYAVAQLTEMMNRIMIACSSEEPVLSVANTYCVPEHFISRFDEEFPFRTTGGGVHKILRMLSMLLAVLFLFFVMLLVTELPREQCYSCLGCS